jgi:hypothetical protein
MKFTTQYISDMISCAESKLAAASTVAWRREYYGMYGLTDSLWHINQLILYIFLLKRWRNWPFVTNASTEEDLSNMFDRIIRMPYPCDLARETTVQIEVNRPPIVEAGTNQNLSAGVTSTTLAGTVTDPDGDPFTVMWTKISGGNVTINSQSTTITTLTNMQPGTYVFRLTATDSKGASASDTVTITIATALDTIYYWIDSDPFPGSGQEAYILGTSSLQANGSLDVTIPYQDFNSAVPRYAGIAIPDLSLSHNKNKWFVDIINQGNIGTPTDLFGAPITVSVNGVDYLVWSTNYKTQFADPCTFKKV